MITMSITTLFIMYILTFFFGYGVAYSIYNPSKNIKTNKEKDWTQITIYANSYFMMKNGQRVAVLPKNKGTEVVFLTERNVEYKQAPYKFVQDIEKEITEDEFQEAFEKNKVLENIRKEYKKLKV